MTTPGAPAGAWSTCAPGTLDVEPALDPGKVFTSFPLPWAIELAALLHGARQADGLALAEWLVDQVPEPARAELRHLAGGSARCGPAAADLLARLPATPAQPLEIFVLGPLQVAFGGVPAAPAKLRRTRVRTLLALLVVHRTLSRERADRPALARPVAARRRAEPAGDADLPAPAARTGATHRRGVVPPARQRNDHHAALLPTTSSSTCGSSHGSGATADQNRGQGDPGRTIALLGAATAWWRGEPLADLASVAGHEHEIEHIRVVQLESLLELGELRLVRGDADRARTDAERALDLDPYSERAHRLAIAAALRTHDQRRTDAVRHANPRDARRARRDALSPRRRSCCAKQTARTRRPDNPWSIARRRTVRVTSSRTESGDPRGQVHSRVFRVLAHAHGSEGDAAGVLLQADEARRGVVAGADASAWSQRCRRRS